MLWCSLLMPVSLFWLQGLQGSQSCSLRCFEASSMADQHEDQANGVSLNKPLDTDLYGAGDRYAGFDTSIGVGDQDQETTDHERAVAK